MLFDVGSSPSYSPEFPIEFHSQKRIPVILRTAQIVAYV
jgi:hypothetical protein